MEFQVGDKAVYPAHGVGIIQSIETMEFEGEKLTFYVVKILDNAMTIKVPIQNADAIGMREIIPPRRVEGVYEILLDRETPPDNQTWNRRYREYMNKIKTGDPIEVAKVLRDLALMKRDKNLSFGEKKMYDQARTLLVQEIAVAKNRDEEDIEKEIDDLFLPGAEMPKNAGKAARKATPKESAPEKSAKKKRPAKKKAPAKKAPAKKAPAKKAPAKKAPAKKAPAKKTGAKK